MKHVLKTFQALDLHTFKHQNSCMQGVPSYFSGWPLSRQCEIPWWFAALLHSTRHVKCYSYHACTSVTVSCGGRNATLHDPKPYT